MKNKITYLPVSRFRKAIQIKYVTEFQIWWLILYLSKDPVARVACETLTTTNKVILAGEIRGPKIEKEEIISKVRNCIKDIGYDQKALVGEMQI